jgi:hypothetical protein
MENPKPDEPDDDDGFLVPWAPEDDEDDYEEDGDGAGDD